MEKYMLPCLFLKFTGIPCPGCGGQRSLLHLLHGEFIEAFHLYPAIYPLLLMGGLVLFNYIRPFKNYSKWVSTSAMLTASFVFINYGVELNSIFHFV